MNSHRVIHSGGLPTAWSHFVLSLIAKSLDFVINRFFMKLFTTKSIETVKYCQEYFDFSLPSVLGVKRVAKFEVSFECFLSVL